MPIGISMLSGSSTGPNMTYISANPSPMLWSMRKATVLPSLKPAPLTSVAFHSGGRSSSGRLVRPPTNRWNVSSSCGSDSAVCSTWVSMSNSSTVSQ
jgi:hypothetical protein